jgi:hypothetical protein
LVTTLPYAQDSDGDGLRDDQEFAGTTVYGVKTDPSNADTDGDGLADGAEKYVKEVSIPTRKTMGTSISVSLDATLSGAPERVEVRYGLSTISVSNFYVQLTRGTTTVVLRSYQGSGLYNYSSKDVTSSFPSHGGTYVLYVYSPVPGGVLEEFALSFTFRTSPINQDSDGDGLNDGEEVTYGSDGWITDPNRADSDGDTWSDGYEIKTRGTNPLSADTDQDGARDNVDLDPLRNLLVVIQVDKIHHGASPWCTPELLALMRVNNDYTWVTEHRVATEERYWSWGCWADISSTSVFYMTYYADVPDDVSTVNIRSTAWSINPGRGDDILVDQSVPYTLGSGTAYKTLNSGNSWITFDIWTYALPKAQTLLITDGNATVAASNGQTRIAGQDRYFVLALDLTSSYGPLVYGVNSIVVPRAIFLESKLKKDFDAGSYWPLADATLYGEDLGRADVSEGVAGTIAKSMSGSDAYNVLDRLLRNKTNANVYGYVDISSYAVASNLPADVVRILPWANVWNGPTGAMPADFWQKIGAAASTVVNALVYVGQLIYKGLVALGTFLVNLAQAIADWGMKALGQMVTAAASAVQRAGELLSSVLDWIIRFATKVLSDAIQGLLSMVKALLDTTIGNLIALAKLAVAARQFEFSILLTMANYVFDLAQKLVLIPVAIRAAEAVIAIASLGVGFVAMKAIGRLTAELIVRTLSLMALSLVVEYLIAQTLESYGWVESSTVDFFKGIGVTVSAAAGVGKIAFGLYKIFRDKMILHRTPWWRWLAVGMSVVGLIVVIISSSYDLPGNVRLFLDLLGIALGFGGLLIYWTESLNFPNRAMDAVSSLGATVEKVAVYAALPVAFARVIVHGRTPGYY